MQRGEEGVALGVRWENGFVGFLAVGGLFVLLQSIIWLVLHRSFPDIGREHGPMENLQALFLMLSTCMYVLKARYVPAVGFRLFLRGIALLMLSFFVLEADTRALPWDMPLLVRLTNGIVRDLWLGALWLVWGVFVLRRTGDVFRAGIAWSFRPAGVLFLLSCIFWVFGWLIDKSMFFGITSTFAEELLESNATILGFLSAVLARGITDGQ